jgi:hypothetical protein
MLEASSRSPSPPRRFVLLWLLTWAALDAGYALGLLLAVPAGAFLLRLFLIQHDCGHGAFFRSQAANDWTGRILGVLTFTPYDYWRRSHAIHHASTGNLDARGTGDVDTLTVAEFRALGTGRRFLYRLYRHPVVLFGIGPAYLFLLRHRLPIGMMRKGWRPWASAMGTNLSIAAIAGALIWALGLKLFLLVHLPITLVAASLGVWFLLRAASVRGHPLGPGRRVELPFVGAARQLALRSAADPALVQRQYRGPPCPSSGQPDTLLPAARGLREIPALSRCSRVTVAERRARCGWCSGTRRRGGW